VALPIDVMEQESDNEPVLPASLHRAGPAAPAGIAEAAAILAARRSPVIVVGDEVARFGAGPEVVALAEALGAAIWTEGIRVHASVPSSHPNFRLALGFDALSIRKALEGADAVLLVGGPFFEEVWFSPGSPFPDGAAVIQVEVSTQRLAYNHGVQVGLIGDPKATLAALLAEVNGKAPSGYREAATRRNQALKALKDGDAAAQRVRAQKRWDNTPISMPRLMSDIAAALPADAIVVDEAITAGPDLARTLSFSKPGDYFGARGGGIGQALPGALGVKVAHPDRPVVAISGDGSSMYSIQALWTAAHHDLPIVFVILNNGEYRILKHNMDVYRQRFGAKPDRPYLHMDLGKPRLGFLDVARGLGLSAERVTAPGELTGVLSRALAAKRPHLIEVVIEAKPA
jgi:benzoylformate decarboxylase